MKPNKLQKDVCELIKRQAQFWINTNDINSPTHFCDIDEEVLGMDDLDDVLAEDISYLLKELLIIVKVLKDEQIPKLP